LLLPKYKFYSQSINTPIVPSRGQSILVAEQRP
jgi:hypothetical protein